MDFKSEIRGVKKLHWEIIDLVQKLGKICDYSKENPERLGSIIREKLRQAEITLETLLVALEDVEEQEIKIEYIKTCNKLKDELKISRQDFRKSLLKSNQNIHLTNQKAREQLLGDTKEKTLMFQRKIKDMRKLSSENKALDASSNVISALTELHQLMESEMSRSNLTLEELELSSNTLQSLQESYLTFSTLLRRSRKLLSELEYANRFDRILIICSLIFFLFVVAWIIYKRLLRRVVHIVFSLFFVKSKNFSKKIIKGIRRVFFDSNLNITEKTILQKSNLTFSSSKDYKTNTFKTNISNQTNFLNGIFHDEL
ncbi:hypothetical protein PORY_000354 [Pneumocystis oryctolagi]|uniref:Uncharacterized protein n=1 Tax=Pneumocystis oryctolagi TaxID=42067 RepID=A0ACB7CFB1_9ASCO|nr:hypothetical protein PORY_000354 [Pneumocystis oryctolagi]